jgi:hypothetical protein
VLPEDPIDHDGHLGFLAAVRALRAAEQTADLDAVRDLLNRRDVEALRDELIAANLVRVAPLDRTGRRREQATFFLTPTGAAVLAAAAPR